MKIDSVEPLSFEEFHRLIALKRLERAYLVWDRAYTSRQRLTVCHFLLRTHWNNEDSLCGFNWENFDDDGKPTIKHMEQHGNIPVEDFNRGNFQIYTNYWAAWAAIQRERCKQIKS